jgi:type IV pilus assembly protein PilN
MRTLESSGWMTNPDLSIIEAKAGDPGLPYAFTLNVLLANPNAPKDLNGDGKPDVPAPGGTAAPAGATPPATPAPTPPATPATGGTAP